MANYLIIGGNSGIGAALVQQLTQAGDHVTTASRSNSDITFDATANIPFHASSLPEKLHGVVYCPGSINLKPFARLTTQDFLDDFHINVLGAINVIRSVLPNLKQAEYASIVLFSTVAVTQGMPFHSSVATSKGGIEGLTKSLAAEFAPHIRVNCIAPSITQTPLAARLLSSEEKIKSAAERHPLKKIGEPQDMASLAAFLLTEESKWITGQILHADGGMSTLRNL